MIAAAVGSRPPYIDNGGGDDSGDPGITGAIVGCIVAVAIVGVLAGVIIKRRNRGSDGKGGLTTSFTAFLVSNNL